MNQPYSFIKALAYFVLLIIVNCSDKNTTEPIESKPEAKFEIQSIDKIVPVTINFVNKSINCTSYHWDFGDGVISAEISPSHMYENAGEYNIKLVANGEKGKDSTMQILNLIDPPIEIFMGIGAAGINVEQDPLSKVIEVHGNNFEEIHSVDAGNNHKWVIKYPTKGLEFHTFEVHDEQSKLLAQLEGILLTAPYKGITDKGIGVGSARADVEAAYPEGRYWPWKNPGDQTFVYGSDWFEFLNDKVRIVQIGTIFY